MSDTVNLKQLRRIATRKLWEGKPPRQALQFVSDQMNAFGVERISEPAGQHLLYVNLGDTYIPTVCWDSGIGKVVVESWGDWLERKEEVYARENGTIRCVWCSSWTPRKRERRETVCCSCGNYVGG